ncbi:hypothetical protein [Paenibacillus tyrfis]|uniref:Uncharacterized protein n=1 Tax=Paenibacillus tyrfis TaxID=1501230 RepID=A0A081NWK2_9BACL|nr:hypothetical protein [Paenibacillus tyrfis]KEQ22825.1 hypothetical protein ET33_20960 [Paenibacillus tyrfis]
MRKKAGVLLSFGLLAGALAGLTWTPSALAGDAQSLAESAETLTLFEPTELYDDRYQQVGVIAPQQVHVLQTSSIRRGHGEGYRAPRYLISTWMGKAWIVPDNALRGKEEPMDMYIELSHEETLYSDPGLLSPKGKIGKQTVQAIAGWGKRYKIATPEGEAWIAPNWAAVGVKLVQTEVQLTAPTKLFRVPHEYVSEAGVNPQPMQVTAVWRDWYRADSWLGPVWFRLHELDAADADHRMEVGLNQRYFDGNQTRIRASAQLGPKWRNTTETIPVGFAVLFYNEKGERIGASSGATVRLKGGESSTIELTADRDIQMFAYATVQVGMFNDQPISNIQPDDPITLADAAYPELRLGAIQVRRDGVFSIVTGQYSSKHAGERHVKAELSFLNADGAAIAKAPLELSFDSSYPGDGLLQPFEAVVPEDVTNYASIALQVTDVK